MADSHPYDEPAADLCRGQEHLAATVHLGDQTLIGCIELGISMAC